MDLWPWIDNNDNDGDHENITNLAPAPTPSSDIIVAEIIVDSEIDNSSIIPAPASLPEKDGDEGADIIAPTPTPLITEDDDISITNTAPAPSPLEDEKKQDAYDDYYSAYDPSMLPW